MKRLARALAIGSFIAATSATPAGPIHLFKGDKSLDRVVVTAVYYLPRDRAPLPDWHDRIDWLMRRVAAFHQREFSGASTLEVRIPGEPYVSNLPADAVREGDATAMFERMAADLRRGLAWPGASTGAFPVLLIFADINHRELDDFTRTRVEDGIPIHEGNIAADGRHHPGAASGGSRARRDPASGGGIALVTADGWRVPYEGSDCVAYHEGLGHTLGLPHPEPANHSVMSTAQYHLSLHRSWIDADQKRAMGWSPPAEPPPSNRLFGAFSVRHEPAAPVAGQMVSLLLEWPADAKVTRLDIAHQTALFGPWHERTLRPPEGAAPAETELGAFSSATPVAWRVRAELADGQRAEMWGYLQVADPAARQFWYDYRHDNPGKRVWRTAGGGLWTETDPSGRCKVFATVARDTTLEGKKGSVLAELPAKSLEVFLPDRGVQPALLRFRVDGKGPWNFLGEVHDFPR